MHLESLPCGLPLWWSRASTRLPPQSCTSPSTMLQSSYGSRQIETNSRSPSAPWNWGLSGQPSNVPMSQTKSGASTSRNSSVAAKCSSAFLTTSTFSSDTPPRSHRVGRPTSRARRAGDARPREHREPRREWRGPARDRRPARPPRLSLLGHRLGSSSTGSASGSTATAPAPALHRLGLDRLTRLRLWLDRDRLRLRSRRSARPTGSGVLGRPRCASGRATPRNRAARAQAAAAPRRPRLLDSGSSRRLLGRLLREVPRPRAPPARAIGSGSSRDRLLRLRLRDRLLGGRLLRLRFFGQLGVQGYLRSPSGGLDRDGAACVLALPGDRVLRLELRDLDLAEGAEVLCEAFDLAELVPELRR